MNPAEEQHGGEKKEDARQKKIRESRERVKTLLDKADSVIELRNNMRKRDRAVDYQQKVFDLRAAIAEREMLKGELEQHRARRGRLTELHNELNVAEEHLVSIKLERKEQEMSLAEIEQKLVDLEGHMAHLIEEVMTMKEDLPKLLEAEYYHVNQMERLFAGMEAAEKLVQRRKAIVQETEANMNYIMNTGMSSAMWQDAMAGEDNSSNRPRLKKSWSVVGKVKGEDFIYEADLTPRTEEFAKKHRADKRKYLWRVVYNAMKLGYLTKKIPFPPDAFARMMAHIHGNNDAETIKRLSEELSIANRVLEEQADSIRKLERQNQYRTEKSRDSEKRFLALQEKYEQARIELAASKAVIAQFDDKSVEQIKRENRLYEEERQVLYAKLYGKHAVVAHNPSPSAPAGAAAAAADVRSDAATLGEAKPATTESIVIPPISQSSFVRSSSESAEGSSTDDSNEDSDEDEDSDDKSKHDKSPSTTSPLLSPGGSAKRIETVSDSLKAAASVIVERTKSFRSGPTGVGFLQAQMDRLLEAERQARKRMEAVKHQSSGLRRKLERAESIALYGFDVFAQGKHSLEEAIDRATKEAQKANDRLQQAFAQEKVALETQLSMYQETCEALRAEAQVLQSANARLEQQCDQCGLERDALTESLAEALAKASALSEMLTPDSCKAFDAVIACASDIQPQFFADSDDAIAAIRPSRTQRTFNRLVVTLLQVTRQTFLTVATELRRSLPEATRKTPESVLCVSNVGTALAGGIDAILKVSSAIGSAGLDAVNNWVEHQRDLSTEVATDVADLPQPPPEVVVVEKRVEIVKVVDSAENDTQTDDGPQLVDDATQTAAATKKDMQVETTIVLGSGVNTEGLGFVSADSMKRMETLLKAKIREADEATQEAENVCRRASAAVQKSRRVQTALQSRLMQSEDCLAHASQKWASKEALTRQRSSVACGVHPRQLGGVGDFQSQVYWKESSPLRLAVEFAPSVSEPPLPTASAPTRMDAVRRAIGHSAAAADGQLVVCAEVFIDPAELHPPSVAETVAVEVQCDGPSSLPVAVVNTATSPTVAMERSVPFPDSSLVEGLGTEPRRPPCSDAEVQTEEQDLLERSLPTFVPLSQARPEELRVVDPELTAHALAQLQEKALEDLELHKQLLEQQVHEKEEDMERHQEHVEREALKLRLKVSDMQQSYEAISASATKFKYMAKQLEIVKMELQREKAARAELEKSLEQSTPSVKATKAQKRVQDSQSASANSLGLGFVPIGNASANAGALSRQRSESCYFPKSAASSIPEAELRSLRRALEAEKERNEQLEQQLREAVGTASSTAGLVVGSPSAELGSLSTTRIAKKFAGLAAAAAASNQQRDKAEGGDNGSAVLTALNDKLNNLQMRLLDAHKELLDERSHFNETTGSLKQQVATLTAAVATAEAALKRAHADEARAKNELARERKEHSDSAAVAAMRVQEACAKLDTEKQRAEQKLVDERRALERSEKALRDLKQKNQRLTKEVAEARTEQRIQRETHEAKARAAATLVSQLHCGLVEAAIMIKDAFDLTTLQLADPIMGETAVQLMKALSSSSSSVPPVHSDATDATRESASSASAGASTHAVGGVSAEALLDMTKFLGDRDVDLLRRVAKAAKYHSGKEDLLLSVESSRPPTRGQDLPPSSSSPANAGIALTPLPTPRRDALPPLPSSSPLALQGDSTQASQQRMPHVQWRSRSPPKPLRNTPIAVADRDQSFSLLPSHPPGAGSTATNPPPAAMGGGAVKSPVVVRNDDLAVRPRHVATANLHTASGAPGGAKDAQQRFGAWVRSQAQQHATGNLTVLGVSGSSGPAPRSTGSANGTREGGAVQSDGDPAHEAPVGLASRVVHDGLPSRTSSRQENRKNRLHSSV